MDSEDKKIDQSWKDKAQKEKEEADLTPQAGARQNEYAELTFGIFISSLGMQALAALGQIENPITKKKEKDLAQARHLIDAIAMLREKTKGNTDEQEDRMFEELLYQLRIIYVNENRDAKI